MDDFVLNFFIFYGFLNLGFHISMILVSSIINAPIKPDSESEPDSELEPDSESEPDSELEPESELELKNDPNYIQPSKLKFNFRKRKSI